MTTKLNAETFINPYSFVPFDNVTRQEPSGHDRLRPGHQSGTITVTWTTRTPLLLPVDSNVVYGQPCRLPGSSLKGAVRSVHEVLAHGCLRVFNVDFVPVHRAAMGQARREEDGWTLARVSETDQANLPSRMQVASEVFWVDHLHVDVDDRSKIVTGDRFSVNDFEYVRDTMLGAPGRKHLGNGKRAVPDSDGDFVILVSDAKARRKARLNDAEDAHYFYAMGRISEASSSVPVADLDTYKKLVYDSDDMRTKRKDDGGSKKTAGRGKHVAVTFKPRENATPVAIGKRWNLSHEEQVGNVVWVRLDRDASKVIDISHAVLWRVEGKHTTSERLPDSSLLSCSDPELLCPSCAIFGMAPDSDSDAESDGRQNSYASHLRFSDAVTADAHILETPRLVPLMSPRPSFGPFYLVGGPSVLTNDEANRGDTPTSHWGSEADLPSPRRLRGRKFYWHADPAPELQSPVFSGSTPSHRWWANGQVNDPILVEKAEAAAKRATGKGETPASSTLLARHERPMPRDSDTPTRRLVDRGQVFTSTIWFDNLSPEQLGSVLGSIEPALLLDTYLRGDGSDPIIRMHLGGGKPIGLGTVEVKIEALSTYGSERYAALPSAPAATGTSTENAEAGSPSVGPAGGDGRTDSRLTFCVQAFAAANRPQMEDVSADSGAALAAVLDDGHVDPHLVWYPPGERREKLTESGGLKQFDSSFKFFAKTDGSRQGRKTVPLPRATDPDQRIGITS